MQNSMFNPITSIIIAAGSLSAIPFHSSNEFNTSLSIKEKINYYTPIASDLSGDLIKKISELSKLNENWDGYGAIAINQSVIVNSNKFIRKMPNAIKSQLRKENITPTPYGTIVLDWRTKNLLVSVEIGSSKIGFFSEAENGENKSIDGIIFNENSLPKELLEAFRDLQ